MEAVARRSLAFGWRNAPGMALGGEEFMSDDTDFRARSDRAALSRRFGLAVPLAVR